MDERRRSQRQPIDLEARVATVAERPMPPAATIDASADGVLLAFSEPVGLHADMRVCVTMRLPDGRVHLMADVARTTRGDDFRTYVAVALRTDGGEPDVDRWRSWLVARQHRAHDSIAPAA